jgi:hypothetical protein
MLPNLVIAVSTIFAATSFRPIFPSTSAIADESLSLLMVILREFATTLYRAQEKRLVVLHRYLAMRPLRLLFLLCLPQF